MPPHSHPNSSEVTTVGVEDQSPQGNGPGSLHLERQIGAWMGCFLVSETSYRRTFLPLTVFVSFPIFEWVYLYILKGFFL